MRKKIVSALVSFLQNNEGEQLRFVLSELGFADLDKALRNIRSLGSDELVLPSFFQLAEQLFCQLARSPDPDAALNNWERFSKAFFGPHHLYALLIVSKPLLQLLGEVFGSSQFLSDVLIRNPEYFDWLIQKENLRRDKTEEEYLSELEQSVALFKSRDARHRAFCRYRRREMLRIGARDILRLADLPQITRELSDLASAIIKVALSICREEVESLHGAPQIETHFPKGFIRTGKMERCDFCVIGMGKLGGRELNFSSDVDLIFLYEDEGETTGREEPDGPEGIHSDNRSGIISNHQFFSRLCELLVNFLSEKTAEGYLYRVDVRLRPEGSSGPLARSLESFENYFYTQARYWEKLAYLKASCVAGGTPRLIAGSGGLFERFEKRAQQFIFAETDPLILVREVAKLKQRIDSETLAPEAQQREVKRGYGGIREIEFITSTLQIINHRKSPRLKVRNTLDALDALEDCGVLSDRNARHLRSAYVFLRRLEHCLQMNYELQCHLLPEKTEELRRLARKMHYRGSSRHLPEESFAADYRRHTARVHRIFSSHFRLKTPAAKGATAEALTLLDEEADSNVLLELLRRYRLREPATLKVIRSLARGSRDVYVASRGQRYFEEILPRLLEICRRLPFPDSALRNLDNFLRAAKGISSFYNLSAGSPKILDLLMRLFGTSDYLSRILISHPEYFDVVVDPNTILSESPDANESGEILASVRKAQDADTAFSILRKWKRLQLLKIGLRDVLGVCPVQSVSQNLSQLAEVCLGASLEIVRKNLVKVYGEPIEDHASPKSAAPPIPISSGRERSGPPRFCMLALGGFGSQEISYFSDLDLIFAYQGYGETTGISPEGKHGEKISNRLFFIHVAEEIIQQMSAITPDGTLFKIDARLRPEGIGSPLVNPMESYFSYYEHDVQLWELQSFLKARTVAGDESLGKQLIEGVMEIVRRRVSRRSRRLSADEAGRGEFSIAEEIYSMRHKLEQGIRLPSTALSERIPSGADFKRGKGGLVDIEFLVQYFQLKSLGDLSQKYPLGSANIRKDPFGTSEVLSQLGCTGIVPREETEFLLTAYAFLRNVESKLRLLFETPRDLFPAAQKKLEPLAVALGYSAEEAHREGILTENLRDDFLSTTQRVRKIFDKYLKTLPE